MKFHGKDGAIYLGYTKVGEKTEWTLSANREWADVSTFRDGNKIYAAGLKDIQGTFSGLLDDYDDLLLAKTLSDMVVYVQLYVVDDAPTNGGLFAYGNAYVDCVVTASVNDAVRITGTFRAAGDWRFGGFYYPV